MESNFSCINFLLIFKDEFENSPLHWVKFFNSKQHETGVIVTDYTYEYKVIDKRKWLLTKIKYGI